MYLITDKRRASRRDRDWRAATGVRVNSEFAKGIASVWVPDPPDRLKNLVDPRFPFVNGNIYGGVSQPMTWTRLPQAVSGHGWLGGSQKVMTVPNGTTDSLIDPLNVWEPPHRGVAEAVMLYNPVTASPWWPTSGYPIFFGSPSPREFALWFNTGPEINVYLSGAAYYNIFDTTLGSLPQAADQGFGVDGRSHMISVTVDGLTGAGSSICTAHLNGVAQTTQDISRDLSSLTRSDNGFFLGGRPSVNLTNTAWTYNQDMYTQAAFLWYDHNMSHGGSFPIEDTAFWEAWGESEDGPLDLLEFHGRRIYSLPQVSATTILDFERGHARGVMRGVGRGI